jgi:hypothetical protein
MSAERRTPTLLERPLGGGRVPPDECEKGQCPGIGITPLIVVPRPGDEPTIELADDRFEASDRSA